MFSHSSAIPSINRKYLKNPESYLWKFTCCYLCGSSSKEMRMEFKENLKCHLFSDSGWLAGSILMALHDAPCAPSGRLWIHNGAHLTICLCSRATGQLCLFQRALQHLVEMNCVILAFLIVLFLPQEASISCNDSLFFFNPETSLKR